jgi:hypothetical protein
LSRHALNIPPRTPTTGGSSDPADAERLQAICRRLGPGPIQALLDKRLQLLPSPVTDADRAAGYRYECSILQAEFSLTQVRDRPATGVLRTGHPGRQPRRRAPPPGQPGRRPPGAARPATVRPGLVPHPDDHRRAPSLHSYDKHTKINQYHQEGWALRTA